ncbi:uncharacterized protein EV422DRAFT_505804 [Fimicolochytrium jonesii]|uniref:uncharacterized protein n=1 Tax=Fimicolochytrium jonesii TaxID=1396493 RepID=UPI0022FDF252|nr:uncharacterized protein EV422DRAFT_505804 [Fimicolochytrium jonesii]KAI8821686.1 hypothetical protein EV422DRAFT_505804 [Fimicolochytrium jonesii]
MVAPLTLITPSSFLFDLPHGGKGDRWTSKAAASIDSYGNPAITLTRNVSLLRRDEAKQVYRRRWQGKLNPELNALETVQQAELHVMKLDDVRGRQDANNRMDIQ